MSVDLSTCDSDAPVPGPQNASHSWSLGRSRKVEQAPPDVGTATTMTWRAPAGGALPAAVRGARLSVPSAYVQRRASEELLLRT